MMSCRTVVPERGRPTRKIGRSTVIPLMSTFILRFPYQSTNACDRRGGLYRGITNCSSNDCLSTRRERGFAYSTGRFGAGSCLRRRKRVNGMFASAQGLQHRARLHHRALADRRERAREERIHARALTPDVYLVGAAPVHIRDPVQRRDHLGSDTGLARDGGALGVSPAHAQVDEERLADVG